MSRTSQERQPRKSPAGRRASPDVVEKRRAARLFNEALLGGGARSGAHDGRTERRRKRLLRELSDGIAGAGKRELKPIDVLSRVQELLELGEPLASIRKASPKPRPVEPTPEVIEGIRRIHRAYTFPAVVYGFVGLDAETLRKAGVVSAAPSERAPGLRRTGPDRAARPPLRRAGSRPAAKRRRAAAGRAA